MKTADNLKFITNFDTVELPHFTICAQKAGIHAVFLDDAVDCDGNKMDAVTAMYVPEEEYDTPQMDIFHKLFIEVADVYKELLLKEEKITQEFADTHCCYLGIEKLYDFEHMTSNEMNPLDAYNYMTYGDKVNKN